MKITKAQKALILDRIRNWELMDVRWAKQSLSKRKLNNELRFRLEELMEILDPKDE